MSMAVSLGSRSSFSGASMMERNVQAETAMRGRGSVGNLTWGDCDAAKALENPPRNTSAAHAVDKAPIKVRRLMDTGNPPNYRKEDTRLIRWTRESAQATAVMNFAEIFREPDGFPGSMKP